MRRKEPGSLSHSLEESRREGPSALRQTETHVRNTHICVKPPRFDVCVLQRPALRILTHPACLFRGGLENN